MEIFRILLAELLILCIRLCLFIGKILSGIMAVLFEFIEFLMPFPKMGSWSYDFQTWLYNRGRDKYSLKEEDNDSFLWIYDVPTFVRWGVNNVDANANKSNDEVNRTDEHKPSITPDKVD